jgi:hypothetical protein
MENRHDEICNLYRDVAQSILIRLKTLQWAGHVVRMDDLTFPESYGSIFFVSFAPNIVIGINV